MILVTGAAGKTGRALLDRLKVLSPMMPEPAVRAFVRTESQAKQTENLACEVMMIYHICPNMHPDEFQIAQNVIAAAQINDVSHFVYHSVLHPQTEDMPHHWQKLRVEEYLFKSVSWAWWIWRTLSKSESRYLLRISGCIAGRSMSLPAAKCWINIRWQRSSARHWHDRLCNRNVGENVRLL